jgi:hypothetical protein
MTKPSERALKKANEIVYGIQWTEDKTLIERIALALDAEAAPKKKVYKDSKKAARHQADKDKNKPVYIAVFAPDPKTCEHFILDEFEGDNNGMRGTRAAERKEKENK